LIAAFLLHEGTKNTKITNFLSNSFVFFVFLVAS